VTRARSARRDLQQRHGRAEVLVTIDDESRRIVWSAQGGSLSHHNGSAQVVSEPNGLTKVVWIADFLPKEAADTIDAMMGEGMERGYLRRPRARRLGFPLADQDMGAAMVDIFSRRGAFLLGRRTYDTSSPLKLFHDAGVRL
jgi:hypothetical protein